VKRAAATCCFAALLVLPASVAAQPEPEPVARPEPPPSPSLRSRFGIDAVRPWLRAEPTLLRQRAFERLGALGSSGAIELLATALGNGGEARDARERLVVVRALAAHTQHESAVAALVRAVGSSARGDEPKDALVEHTAALALARSRNPRAAKALFQALRQPGRVAAVARIALRAYPPRDLDALLAAPGVPTSELLELLGELAKPRAATFLASIVHHGTPALRGAALSALARCDPAHAVALARVIVRAEPASDLGIAASGVLARANAPEVPQLIAALLRVSERRSDALTLSLAAPSPAVGAVLARAAESPDFERLAAALGRAGGPAAEARLERWLGDSDRGWAAAYALAQAEDGGDVLERAAERDASRRVAVLGLALRAGMRGSKPSIARDTLARLTSSKLEADRGAAAFALALIDPERATELARGRDLASVRAIARAGLDPELGSVLAARLAGEKDAPLRAALAICLAVPAAADRVPTDALLELVETHGAATPLAAYALAARDGKVLRPLLSTLLASSDPSLRAHVALGLARSDEASAVGLLAATYRFEPDARVRRAVIRALAARRERGRALTLRLARDLDPDDTTRALAGAALAAEKTRQPPSSQAAAWLRITPSVPASATPLALIELANGLVVPAAADADGSVTLIGLPTAAVSVNFAAAAPGTKL
jgi:HEAT repeat protein